MVDTKQPGGIPSADDSLKVRELLALANQDIQSIDPALASSLDLSMLKNWQSMTNSLIHSKFAGLVSHTFDGVAFAGLNDFITSRYLSDDPSYSFGLPDFDRFAHFGFFGQRDGAHTHEGYRLFEHADFSIVELFEELYESGDFRQSVFNNRQKSSSLFGPKSPTANRQRATERAQNVRPYPKSMGNAGRRMLTPTQRRAAQVHGVRAPLIADAAQSLVQRTQHTGPAVLGRFAQTNTSNSIWSPEYLQPDSAPSAFSDMSVESVPWDILGEQPPNDHAVTIGDLAVSNRNTPALASAISVANKAGRPRFLPASRQSVAKKGLNPRLAAMATESDSPSFSPRLAETHEFGSSRLVYDAVEHTWLAVAPTETDFQPTASMDMPSSSRKAHNQTSSLFTTSVAAGQLGASVTRPEIFSAQQIRKAQQNTAEPTPISRRGDMRFEQFGMAAPVADPVVYVTAPEQAHAFENEGDGVVWPSTPALSSQQEMWNTGTITNQISTMSPALADAMQSITMPLSSVTQLDDILMGQATMPDANIADEPSFYRFAYDAESVFVKPDLASWDVPSWATTHAEVRGNQLVRSVPKTAAAAKQAQVKPMSLTSHTASTAASTLVKSSEAVQLQAAEWQQQERVNTGGVTPLLAKHLSPVLAQHPMGSAHGRPALTRNGRESADTAGIRAMIADADLSALPVLVQQLLGNQVERSLNMTQSGSQVSSLMARVEALGITNTPGTRTALMHHLVSNGVDTPTLVQILDELDTTTSTGITAPSEPGAHDVVSTKRETLLKRAATTLKELGINTNVQTLLKHDEHFGAFAPARLERQGLDSRLKALLAPRTAEAGQPRPSALSLQAEDPTHVRLDSKADSQAVATESLAGVGLVTGAKVARAPAAAHRTIASNALTDLAPSTTMTSFAPATVSSMISVGTATTDDRLPPVVRAFLQKLPSDRPVSQFLGKGFDFVYSVLDRANGAFAGLDAGVLESLAELSALRTSSGDGRTMHPGLDPWSREDMTHVASLADAGDTTSPMPHRTKTPKPLEKRTGAAQSAFARMHAQRRSTRSAPSSFDGIDWSLVNTGSSRDTSGTAFGDLGAALTQQAAVPPAANMTMVAPVVKAVAQTAQLKETSEAVGGGGAGRSASGAGKKGGKKAAKKPNYQALARQVMPYVRRFQENERRRSGRAGLS